MKTLDPIASRFGAASSRACTGLSILTILALGGCAVAGDDELSTNQAPSWEEFRDETYRETFEGGQYIVNGDIAVADDKNLLEFWESLTQGGLIVNTAGGQDTKWNDTQKLNLTYCISTNFGSNRTAVITAFNAAAANWESRGNVNFIHLTAEDSNCTASNPNVLFDVRQVSGQSYLARAFFPNNARASRNVLVDTSSFGNLGNWELDDIIAHELGHVLGFRHEHTRPEAGTCFEDTNWRPLTPYDSASIMHYPQCNGASTDLEFSARDTTGIQALYGAPGGGGPVEPPPTGTTQTKNWTGSLSNRQTLQLTTTTTALSVKPGSNLTVVMTGTGDPDLYVRFGAQPTQNSWNCRPYVDGGSEQCTLTVPANQTRAFVMVRNFLATTSTFNITATYTPN